MLHASSFPCSTIPSLLRVFPLHAFGTRARNKTRLRWLEGACDNHSTMPDSTLAYQNAVFKPNVWEKSNRGLRLIAVACMTFEKLASTELPIGNGFKIKKSS